MSARSAGEFGLIEVSLKKIVERIKKEFSEISPIYKEYIKKKKKKPVFFEIFGGIFGGLLGEETAEDFLDFDYGY